MIALLLVSALMGVSMVAANAETYCSAPPASLEICLSSVFSEIETGISAIMKTLKEHESTIESQMHHERTLLHSEISWVARVKSIAEEVETAVDIDYSAIEEQQYALHREVIDIHYAYYQEKLHIQNLHAEIVEISEEMHYIKSEYEHIQQEKWTLYQAISAIQYEKLVIQKEENEIEKVIGQLHEEMVQIYTKVSQLNKRQKWLESWESKLYVDIEEMQEDIVEFREVENDLYAREEALYEEQNDLEEKVKYVESCLESLNIEYANVVAQLNGIQNYESRLRQVQASVSAQASVFVHAYEDFTCEDSLLYYEACSKSKMSAMNVAVAPVVEAPAVAPMGI